MAFRRTYPVRQTTNQKITGIVEQYNQTKGMPAGIKVNGNWYNATDVTAKYVDALMDKIGSEIELEVNGKQITFLKIISEKSGTGQIKKQTTMTNNNNFDSTDKRIVRQNVLSHATNITLEAYKKDKIQGDRVVETVLNIAEQLEAWVYRDEILNQQIEQHEKVQEERVQ